MRVCAAYSVFLLAWLIYFRYIKLFGVRMTKEDHIKFVHLAFQLVVVPDQEISVTNIFTSAFERLLK